MIVSIHAPVMDANKGGNATRYEIAEYAVKQANLLIKELDKKQA